MIRDLLHRAFGHTKALPRVHMLHIGKTGGSSVKHALKPHLTSGAYEIILHPHRVKLPDIPVGEPVFFFLRDPLSRFVSGFYSRQRQGAPRYHSPWDAQEQEAFAHFHTADQLARALSDADAAESDRAERAMRGIGHVRDTYWTFLKDRSYFDQRSPDILFIGFQGSLDADFAELKKLLGIQADVELPRDDVHAHRNPEHVDKRLSDLARANLSTWYADDIALVEHCRARRSAPR